MKYIVILLFTLLTNICKAQLTIFEQSNGTATATYAQIINFYKTLAANDSRFLLKTMGPTDAHYPLHTMLVSNDKNFEPTKWHQQNKIVIFINNGIHPGEPDGIDASMLLLRDIHTNKIKLPNNIVLAVIPVYNIGGCLNRNSSTRVNQNGPIEYGFRGNAQNLDLNRDFTKNDSKEAKTFATIFHWLQPQIFIDNHVSDGADYQHTMTLITTQYNKLGPTAGTWLRNFFEPQLYAGMQQKKWDLIPYVEFDGANFNKGIDMFYETPRYSSGYAALFGTFAFIPETHMLKPYKERVTATYDLLNTFIEKAAINATTLLKIQQQGIAEISTQKTFPLKWRIDRSVYDSIIFKGYEQDTMLSAATGLQKMYYNKLKPYTRSIKYFNNFKPENMVEKPMAYFIPTGWNDVIERLRLNKINVTQLKNDTIINVTVYRIEDYKSRPTAYEKHHVNYQVKTSSSQQPIQFLKGDYIIYLNQKNNRYIIEMLEPTGDDSFFAWNFFDGILQQKEGYSDYRWDDIAADILKNDADLQKKLADKKATDAAFAQNSNAILNFIYKNSKWFEKAYLQYPVYRIEHQQSINN
ncbi:M14 family zinc carboxypeptidase [Ferruginibacter yonginensis]|uniref:M14 family zinc carboxypeptidase n=1 Tax=Ferruginibacter yonginensis TaxID=1310416 RepID=A0ABV8QWU3_9BACT